MTTFYKAMILLIFVMQSAALYLLMPKNIVTPKMVGKSDYIIAKVSEIMPAGHLPSITVHGWSAQYNRVIARQLTVALNKQNKWNDEFIYYPVQR